MGSRLSTSGGGSATTDASQLTTGTLPLARLSGITTSQLAAGAAITSGQIASVAASTITGTNTLPDGVLSTNVPLLNAANTFTAAQTISATVAGPLAQVNNASTTGGGIVVGSTTVASAGAGKIAPALALTQTTPATANYGLFSVGGGPWDGSTTGKFASSSNGCLIAGNAVSGFSGNLLDLQLAGTSRIKIDQNGAVVIGTVGSLRCPSYSPSTFQAAMTIGDGGAIAVSGQATHTPNAAGNVPLICKGVASQTADLLQVQNSAAAVQFAVTNRGSAGSPIWAIKVRATANAESMAQAHTIGAATGKAIEVMDDAGSSLGWLALYA